MRGESTRRTRSTRTPAGLVRPGAAPGRHADGRASGQTQRQRAASLRATRDGARPPSAAGERGGEVKMNNMKTARPERLSTTGFRRRDGARSSERRGTKGKPKFVQTHYGNWIRWLPPAPRQVEALQEAAGAARSTKRPKTKKKHQDKECAQKRLLAEQQLKRKVKALEKKCAGLQQQVQQQQSIQDSNGAAQRTALVVAGLTTEWMQREQQRQAAAAADRRLLQQQVVAAVAGRDAAQAQCAKDRKQIHSLSLELEQAERDWEYCGKQMQEAHNEMYELKKKMADCGFCSRHLNNW